MRKFVKNIAVATALATTLISNPAPVEAASTMTVQQAAKKIYAAETKAYNTKKDVSLKLTFKAKNNSVLHKIADKVETALLQEELGDVDLTNVKQDAIFPAMGNVYFCGTKAEKKDYSESHDWNFYYNASYGYDASASYKNGVATVKMTVKGSKKFYRDQYKEQKALRKIMEIVNDHIEGLSEKDAAWKINTLLRYDREEDPDENGSCQCGETLGVFYEDQVGSYKTAPTDILAGKASGACEHLSLVYHEIASLAGLDAAYVSDGTHGWNAVKIDGEVYHLSLQDSHEEFGEWEGFTSDTDGSTIERVKKLNSNATVITYKDWVPGISKGEWYLFNTKDYDAKCKATRYEKYTKPSTWKYTWDFNRLRV